MTIMYKYGGVYSDLDTITLKSFEPLLSEGKNGFGEENYLEYKSINNAILVFNPRSPYLKYVVEKLPKIYKPNEWATNGPILLYEAVKEFCEIKDVHFHFLPGYYKNNSKYDSYKQSPIYLNNTHKCFDLRVYPQHFFYPFLWHNEEFKKIFEKDSKDNHELKHSVSNSFSIHYYGQLSSKYEVKPGDNTFFTFIAEEYCSFTYKYVKANDLSF